MPRFIMEEKGSVAVLIALAMVVLIGFSALAIDVGYLYFRKSQLMSIADAASLAGAIALRDNEGLGDQAKKEAIETSVQENLRVNGYKDYDLIRTELANEVGQDSNKVYVLLDKKQVHVNLTQPERWFLASVLSSPSIGALAAPIVGSQARAEVSMSTGEDVWGRTIVSFSKTGKPSNVKEGIEFDGNVKFTSENVSVHSNYNIEVNGGGTGKKGAGFCVSKPLGSYSALFSSIEEGVEPLESPFKNLSDISSQDELEQAFPNITVKYTTKLNDLKNIKGPRIVYFKGNLKTNDNISIDTNRGLAFIEGNIKMAGQSKLKINGLLYVTGDISFGGGSLEIDGGLWSEETIKINGNASTFSHQTPDPSLGLQGGTPTIRLVQ